jgi:hypothetical protein
MFENGMAVRINSQWHPPTPDYSFNEQEITLRVFLFAEECVGNGTRRVIHGQQ